MPTRFRHLSTTTSRRPAQTQSAHPKYAYQLRKSGQSERAKPPSTLSQDERAGVLAVINSAQYADLSICQIWARELDEDRYHCSMSSMYRIVTVTLEN